jgi:hypothetical protein
MNERNEESLAAITNFSARSPLAAANRRAPPFELVVAHEDATGRERLQRSFESLGVNKRNDISTLATGRDEKFAIGARRVRIDGLIKC